MHLISIQSLGRNRDTPPGSGLNLNAFLPSDFLPGLHSRWSSARTASLCAPAFLPRIMFPVAPQRADVARSSISKISRSFPISPGIPR